MRIDYGPRIVASGARALMTNSQPQGIAVFAQQFTWSGRQGIADQSDIGIRPGQWPNYIDVQGKGSSKRFNWSGRDADGTITYRTTDGFVVRLAND